jgi:predicted RND superfamily exporter protein
MTQMASNRQKTFGIIGIVTGLIWIGIRVIVLPLSYSSPIDFLFPVVIVVLSFLYYKGKLPAKK